MLSDRDSIGILKWVLMKSQTFGATLRLFIRVSVSILILGDNFWDKSLTEEISENGKSEPFPSLRIGATKLWKISPTATMLFLDDSRRYFKSLKFQPL